MSKIEFFVWLAGQSLHAFVFFGWPFVSPALLVLLCVVLGFDIHNRRPRAADFAFSLLPLLGTVAILASGVVFQKMPEYHIAPLVGLALCLVLCVTVIVKLRRMRATALMVSVLILWFSLWCVLMAAMAISDDWL